MATTQTLRPELEMLPSRMEHLPVHRGYPVPWFVEWVRDGRRQKIGDGEPDFRIMSSERLAQAIRGGRCWVCGKVIHSTTAVFVIGPMCAVNRVSAEPPSHRECAEWSARNCPFLSRPHARRREAGMPTERTKPAGVMIERNPGVGLAWGSSNYSLFDDGKGGRLFHIGDPKSVSWWAHGRPATREEVMDSINSGIPTLMPYAEAEGDEAVRELGRAIAAAMEFVPTA